ncbi:MAG: BrnT family toxin [Gemmatimonadota bacterium]|nr:BrnT family toxin [Gemmatimonadota bacterium]
MLRFDWDPAKAASNAKKHGITFPEAATAFSDPLSLTIPDPMRSLGEARFVLMGLSYRGRLVVVAHAEAEDSIRIISARSATNAERRSYERET